MPDLCFGNSVFDAIFWVAGLLQFVLR